MINEAIEAYRSITASDEFKELERLRSLARHNEASALGHARDEERAKWQGVVREKDAAIAEKDTVLAEKDTVLAEKDAVLAEKDAAFAKQAALIEELQRKLETID